jgi:hypothetical protein
MRVRLPAAMDTAAVSLLAAASGIYQHWPALTNPLRFDNNWRQAPHWISPDRAAFHPDDAMLRFAEFGTSQVADLIYQTLALTGQDLLWGKVNAILFFVAFIAVAFLVGRAMGGRLVGWTAALLLLTAPSIFREFGGGFMDGLSASMLALAVLIIVTEKWKWSVPLIAFQTLQYPMVAIHSGMIFLVDALVHDRRKMLDPKEWRRKYGYLTIAAVVMGLLIAAKYLVDHGFGELATRATMGGLPEFRPGARSVLLPVSPLFRQIEGRLFDAFHLVLFLFAFAHVGKRALRLPRGLIGLLLGSIVMYQIADLALFRFYFPNRYMHFSFPLFLALASGYWVKTVLSEARERAMPDGAHPMRRWAAVGVVGVVLLVVGYREYGRSARQGQTSVEFTDVGLYEWVEQLPGRPMIVLDPAEASQIPVITGKSVFIMQELSQPYWSNHWDLAVDRTQDFYTAYYATDPLEIIRFTEENDIDYWIVQPEHFSRPFLATVRIAPEPFGSWVRAELDPGPDAVLAGLDESVAEYADREYLGISSEALIEWLGTR